MVDPITSLLIVSYLATTPITTRNPNYFDSPKKYSAGVNDACYGRATEYTITTNYGLATASLISPQSIRSIPPDCISLIKNELDTYRFLENGWDGEDSLKPTEQSITRAKTIIDNFPSGLPIPTPMLSRKGEVGFYWNNENFYADLQLESDKKISYYARKKSGDFPEIFHDGLLESTIIAEWFKDNAVELYLA